MKLQNKSTLSFFLVVITFLVIISASHYFRSRNFTITKTLQSAHEIVDEFAHHIEEHLEKDAHETFTLSSAPIIKQSLVRSNAEFSLLTEEQRVKKIADLNEKWMETKDENDPFIQAYMTNPVAEYLKNQQKMFPDDYGEIFLTNRYGVIIATTNKLTTLAHAHKYWWLGSYHEGKGRVFFDDRGYDDSAKGYVLGVVVPVTQGEEILGILKCNLNIIWTYSNIFNEYTKKKTGNIKLVRTGGLIVFEKDKEPLSGNVEEPLIEKMRNWSSESFVMTMDGIKQIVSYAPVLITRDSDLYGFGGTYESIDHIKGNQGEGWVVVFSRDLKSVLAITYSNTRWILIIGVFFTLLMMLGALLFGRKIAEPVVRLVKMTNKVGKGDFNIKIKVTSKDEIGELADSFNKMVRDLRETTTSRDKLLKEIEDRKKAEKEIRILRGIIPICSYCKQIRNDKGAWSQAEAYITEHTEAEFSHGICPDCAKKYYPDFIDDNESD